MRLDEIVPSIRCNISCMYRILQCSINIRRHIKAIEWRQHISQYITLLEDWRKATNTNIDIQVQHWRQSKYRTKSAANVFDAYKNTKHVQKPCKKHYHKTYIPPVDDTILECQHDVRKQQDKKKRQPAADTWTNGQRKIGK